MTLIVLGVGLIMTGHAVLTPLLQALSMLAGDFVTMARAADRAEPSPYPNAWRIRNLILAAIPFGFLQACLLRGRARGGLVRAALRARARCRP